MVQEFQAQRARFRSRCAVCCGVVQKGSWIIAGRGRGNSRHRACDPSWLASIASEKATRHSQKPKVKQRVAAARDELASLMERGVEIPHLRLVRSRSGESAVT